jgi:hypothetical protein
MNEIDGTRSVNRVVSALTVLSFVKMGAPH